MSRISPAKAIALGYTSQATLYRDMSTGKVSYTRDGKNKRLIDVSELVRVYGEPQKQNDTQRDDKNSHNHSLGDNDKDKIITVLEAQVQDLQSQISVERTEKQQLMNMLETEQANLKTEQEKNKLLMLSPPKAKRSSNIVSYFRNMFTSTQAEPID